MVMLFVLAVTEMVPASVVVRSPAAVCVTPVPPVRLRSPVVELTTALTVINPPVERMVTSPEPCAVTTASIVKAPAFVLRSMFPLAERVLTPVPPMIRALDS